jgi:hypothetical protein
VTHGSGGLSHGVARARLPGAASVTERYRRVAEPAVRGVAGVAVTVALFAAAGAVGGRGGAAIAGAWMLAAGLYCVANFWHCREAHCAVTGPGWTLVGVLGLAAAVTPGGSMAWYRVSVQAAVFLVVLGAGYGMEYVVAARTGRRSLGGGARHAEDR